MIITKQFIKTILGGWIGLNNLVTFKIGREYEYKCDYEICKKPSNFDELSVIINPLLKGKPMEKKIIKHNATNNKLYDIGNIREDGIKKAMMTLENSNIMGTLDAKECTLYYSSSQSNYKYVPISCIQKFDKGAHILNTLDNKTYILVDWDKTPIASDNLTIIIRMENTNILFVIFGFGVVPTDPMEMNPDNNMEVVINVIDKIFSHISEKNTVVLCGHSSGIVNAFLVAEIIRLVINNPIDIIIRNILKKYNTYVRKKNEELGRYEEDIDTRKSIEHINEINENITKSITARNNYVNTLTRYINEIIEDQSDEEIIIFFKMFNEWIDSFHDVEKYVRTDYLEDGLNPGCLNPIIGISAPDWETATRYIMELEDSEENNLKPYVYEISSSKNEKIKNVTHKFVNMIAKLREISDQYHLSTYDKKNIIKYLDYICYNEERVTNNLYQLRYEELENEILDMQLESCKKLRLKTKKDIMGKINKIKNLDKLYDIHNNIFICGSAGFPCFGENLINYAELKKFYHDRILHFRKSNDYYLEKLMEKNPTIHRSDLIEIAFDSSKNKYDVIFHDADTLKEEQKKINYSQKVSQFEFHEWGKAYKGQLIDLYNDDESLNKLLTFITKSNISGGNYYQKYIKYKAKYINLKSHINS